MRLRVGLKMVKKVLIVDDEPSVLYTIKHGLEGLDKDYEIMCADSGDKCFDLLENKQIPDLIILDLLMPSMNGWEVQKKLQTNSEWRDIPIIFLTAVSDEASKRIGNLIGRDYIEKPVKTTELKKRIDKILKA